MNATQSNALSSFAQAINWLSNAYWYEHVDITQVEVNLDRAKENIKDALEDIEQYRTTLNK